MGCGSSATTTSNNNNNKRATEEKAKSSVQSQVLLNKDPTGTSSLKNGNIGIGGVIGSGGAMATMIPTNGPANGSNGNGSPRTAWTSANSNNKNNGIHNDIKSNDHDDSDLKKGSSSSPIPSTAPNLLPAPSLTITSSTNTTSTMSGSNSPQVKASLAIDREPSPSPPETHSSPVAINSTLSPTGVYAQMAQSNSQSPLHLNRESSSSNNGNSNTIPSVTITVAPSSSPGLSSATRLAPLLPSPTAAAAMAAAGTPHNASSPSLRPRPLLPNHVNNSPSLVAMNATSSTSVTNASTGGSARGTPSPIPSTPSPAGTPAGHHHININHNAAIHSTPGGTAVDVIMHTTSAGIVARLLAEARAQALVSTNDELAPVGEQGPQARHAAERFARAFFQAHSVSIRREVAAYPSDQRALWAADRAATQAGTNAPRRYYGRDSRPVSFSLNSRA
jgi:hypothetical protein